MLYLTFLFSIDFTEPWRHTTSCWRYYVPTSSAHHTTAHVTPLWEHVCSAFVKPRQWIFLLVQPSCSRLPATKYAIRLKFYIKPPILVTLLSIPPPAAGGNAIYVPFTRATPTILNLAPSLDKLLTFRRPIWICQGGR
jgi:hypothetical protein